MADVTREDMEASLSDIAERIQRRAGDLSGPEQVFALVWEVEAEVNNGGFELYLENTSGRHAPAAVEALRAVEALGTAALVEKALQLMGSGFAWEDDVSRRDALAKVDEDALDALDGAFYRYPDDLSERLYAYAVRYSSDF